MQKSTMAIVLVILAGTFAALGQVGSSPTQLVHPILKDPNSRKGVTSLNSNPGLVDDSGGNQVSNRSATLPSTAQPSVPGATLPKIDSGLAASKLSMIGTINGVRGTLYVTNTSSADITPFVQLMVCDQKGYKVGVVSKIGTVLAPNADEKIVILATNLNATDLKLVRLTSAPKN
jgi:hypothetical protein